MQLDQRALAHRSIRKFTGNLTAEERLALTDVAQATASSRFGQQFSLIHVADPAKRAVIAGITHGDFVAGPTGDLFIFVVDQHRNHLLMQNSGQSLANLENWDAFLAGVFDATLAAQNMVAAAERSGLGACFLGSILNDPAQMIDLLNLPQHTFPLLGLIVGRPAETPEAKPRLPHDAVVGEDTYPKAVPLGDYDARVQSYYATRSWGARDERFTSMLQAQLTADLAHRNEIGAILKRQGFNLPDRAE
ncbi:nitroreductase family protein [Lacticaseibacillus yichunensis]|uniref:Nitroreductase family protein n=1 Tax=Lacticaseibacillus yichunensis TaxID=2486015 RepID=A0ABW4CNE8_9LACO|nr:nitroreductase family protein [Lacticaseibacillus yichunensis]